MTNPAPGRGLGRQALTTLPQGETVATYAAYPQALEAVEKLAKAEFPVTDLSIVGNDLKSVERITGRMSWARAAGRGALGGAWVGAFLGLLTLASFTATATSPTSLLSWLLMGAGAGMIFGIISYSITRRRKDVLSVTQVLATSYSLIVTGGKGPQARLILGQQGSAPVAPPTATPPTASSGEGTAASAATPSTPSAPSAPDEAPRA